MEKSEIETIYRKYFHDVFLYIRALSENESLAEEITQETFLKAYPTRNFATLGPL